MMNTAEFAERFAHVAATHGCRRRCSPTDLVTWWEQLVGQVEEGYEDNIYEYHNDLFVRGLVEAVLHDPDLAGAQQMSWLRERIAEIDGRFESLLRPEPVKGSSGLPWWEARIPAHAGAELASDFADRYGVVVEVR